LIQKQSLALDKTDLRRRRFGLKPSLKPVFKRKIRWLVLLCWYTTILTRCLLWLFLQLFQNRTPCSHWMCKDMFLLSMEITFGSDVVNVV